MSETQHTTGAPGKPRRDKLTVIPVLAFKPPRVEGDDAAPIPVLVFVDERGNERSLRSTPNMWRSVDGNPGVNRRHAGLDGKDGRRRFWIYVEGSGGAQRAVSFTDFPHPDFLYSKATGTLEVDPEEMLVQIDKVTGSLKILQVPGGTRLQQVEAVVRAIDKATDFEPGQMLCAGSEVTTVSGNRITCSLPILEERGVGRSI